MRLQEPRRLLHTSSHNNSFQSTAGQQKPYKQNVHIVNVNTYTHKLRDHNAMHLRQCGGGGGDGDYHYH